MAKISEDKIYEIRTALNIVHYISQFVNLKKTGKNYKGLCPFHTEKTPSFIVSPDKQIFHCFGCGKGGNIYTFIMDYEKLSFLEAIKKAADFAGIILPKTKVSPSESNYFEKLYQINETACQFFENTIHEPKNKKLLGYFLNRNISPELIKTFRLGYAPDSYTQLLNHLEKSKIELKEAAKLGLIQEKENNDSCYDKFRHRVIFPFQNVSGKIIGFGGRKLKEEQQPKYLNSPESLIYKKGEILYGLHQAITSIRNKEFVILVEGYFDLLRLVENGIKHVVASSGTALSEEQVKLIRRYTKNIYIAYDGDEAGIKAAIRNSQIIEQYDLNAFIITLPADEDPDSFILNYGMPAFEALIKQKVPAIEFQIDVFFKTYKDPSIEQKDQFIQDILNYLVELRNQIKLGLYIHQLAERLQINENLLINQINHLKRYKRRVYPGKASSDKPETAAPQRKIYTGIYKAEAGLIGLLINGSQEIQNYIIENVFHELFENEEFIILYEYIMHELEEVGNLDIGKIVETFQENEKLKQVISEIALENYSNSTKFAKDCIFQLKKWQLEKKAREISTLIKKEESSSESIIHYNKELFQIRKDINLLDKEHRRNH